jgi:hypothetical protein
VAEGRKEGKWNGIDIIVYKQKKGGELILKTLTVDSIGF